jgi:hypothetical protein
MSRGAISGATPVSIPLPAELGQFPQYPICPVKEPRKDDLKEPRKEEKPQL